PGRCLAPSSLVTSFEVAPQCGQIGPCGQTRASSHSRALVSSVKIGFWRFAAMTQHPFCCQYSILTMLCQGYSAAENKEGTSVRYRSGSLRAAVGQRGSSSPRALRASRRRLAEYSRRMCDETDLHRSRVCGIGGTAGFGTIGGRRAEDGKA